jgi:hypothetical protein
MWALKQTHWIQTLALTKSSYAFRQASLGLNSLICKTKMRVMLGTQSWEKELDEICPQYVFYGNKSKIMTTITSLCQISLPQEHIRQRGRWYVNSDCNRIK